MFHSQRLLSVGTLMQLISLMFSCMGTSRGAEVPQSDGGRKLQDAVVSVPAPETAALPAVLRGFACARLDEIRRVPGLISPQLEKEFGEDFKMEKVCGIPASLVKDICFGVRSHDQTGVVLVRVTGDHVLKETVKARLDEMSGGQLKMLAVQIAADELLVLHTRTPERETREAVESLHKDLAAMRASVVAGPAVIWGRAERDAGEAFGGFLPGMYQYMKHASPFCFDIRRRVDGVEFRFTAGGRIGNTLELAGDIAAVFATAVEASGGVVPEWRGQQSADIFSGCCVMQEAFLKNIPELIETAEGVCHAKNVQSCYTSAIAAGCRQFDGVVSPGAIIQLLRNGVKPPEGKSPAGGFRLEMEDREAAAAARCLAFGKRGLELESGKGTGSRAELGVFARGLIAALCPGSPLRYERPLTAKAKRDAQRVASAYAAACVAGCTAFEGFTTVEQYVRAVRHGVRGKGEFSGQEFRVEMSALEGVAAARYLELPEPGTLSYRPAEVGE